MLKMERNAARTARCNTRVVDMDELKRARERRASSVRHSSEEYRPTDRETKFQNVQKPARGQQKPDYRPEDHDDLPFWERDEPFGSPKKAARQQPETEGQPARMENARPRKEARPQCVQPERRAPRLEARPQQRQLERRESRQDATQETRYNARPDERHQLGKQERQPSAKSSRFGHYMLLILLAMAAVTVVIGLNAFAIKNIDVTGNNTVTADSVIALSGINKGENILKINLDQAKKNIESDPLLEVLGISRVLPDKIKIDIRQRAPHGAIAWLGSYVIIDETGYVLDVRPDLPAGQYPLVSGIDVASADKGKKVTGANDAEMKTMYDLLTALYNNSAMQYVSSANLANNNDIMLLTGEGIQIDMGRATDLDKKAQWIACTVPELRTHGYTSGMLYVTGANSPVFSATDGAGSKDDTTDKGDAGGQDDSSGNAA